MDVIVDGCALYFLCFWFQNSIQASIWINSSVVFCRCCHLILQLFRLSWQTGFLSVIGCLSVSWCPDKLSHKHTHTHTRGGLFALVRATVPPFCCRFILRASVSLSYMHSSTQTRWPLFLSFLQEFEHLHIFTVSQHETCLALENTQG